ncbi:ABC transporter permease [Priestia endophytica]|jgi:osmoprotectant transport system permease protein|uniref:ABC transporter permease n=1 Tax=Priestia endophytica TaxID=135735 RepID=UPI000DCA67D5|nr:ABC transporter permease [Priestia endophytica]KAB2496498.1 ABC transporter permease [Priestia endophytica]RAS83384.1 choline ABC transporter permease [Priestia endophytica]
MDTLKEYGVFLQSRYPEVLSRLGEHLLIVVLAVIAGCILSITVAILLTRIKEGVINSLTFGLANIFQTVPTIALLAMLIPLFGVGIYPAIFALFLYSILPLLRNTYSGIKEVDQSLIESARGMGFSSMQRLFKVELPLSLPYILSGVRLTTVYIISWTTLAALIGAGGLGDLIVSGMSTNNNFLIFTGTISSVILALVVDFLLNFLVKKTQRA